ncbi:2-dehydropantoate 2-reductase [Microbacterium sp. ET2]|uniref:ketopantoate reductase family protein n=1 Tax=Microbacterium albipurpureum TaxID=3050384 RepID=UPI00259C93B8|nr:2-dehydropantoate 2-reductase [Microbacterium sp. ET2 (Ac-2212)]WJL96179.1 2-dehydropantoate 2-reductase [Microbacterium sp. ET2 (Ac-2212)]
MVGPRVAVVGAGANGASIGADLHRAGVDVTLVEQWPAHVETIRSEGLRIITPDDELDVRPRIIHLCEVAELRSGFDVVLLVMKAYDAGWASRLIAPYLEADGVMAAVQNGMTADAVTETVGASRAVGAVIECSATMTEPAVVHRHTPRERSWFAVGPLPGGTAAIEPVADLLALSGTVARFDDILSAKWMKLVSNCTLLVTSAILGLPMLDALHQPGFRDVMVAAGDEALAVGGALGHRILPIFGLEPADLDDPRGAVEVMTDRLFAGFVVPGATTTVLQDWRKGRHSEVDDLNGEVVRRGAELGIPTPVNAAITEIAHRIERGEIEPGASHLPLLLDALR